MNYARLAKALSGEGKNEKAIEVLDYCMAALPIEKISFDPYIPDIIEAYFAAGGAEKAVEMSAALCEYYYNKLDYFLRQDPFIINSAEFEIQTAIQYTSRVANACATNGKTEMADEINKRLESYYGNYVRILQPSSR